MIRIATLILTSLLALNVTAQEAGLGCIYDPATDGKVPMRPQLETRDYTVLPARYSLKSYCPTPRSQSIYGTCTAWSTTYAARTICEAVNRQWQNADSIAEEAFAPLFIYRLSVAGESCEEGASIATALGNLRAKGAPKVNSFDVLCANYIPDSLYDEAARYKLSGYLKIFDGYTADKVATVKKALTANHPVVVCMRCFESFDIYDGSDVWDGVHDELRGLHAMCVVGYDDEKYGGAFEIMNSWGTDFAANGFVWVRYSDFINDALYAYDVFSYKTPDPKPSPDPGPKPTPDPGPKPTPDRKMYSISGSLGLVQKDGGDLMKLSLISGNDSIPHYVVDDTFLSGKRFRLSVSNAEPAWVYVIASDLSNNITKLFPYHELISPYLNYPNCHLPVPDESHEFELDDNAGTDYFCVLYSQEELDIDAIISEMKAGEGTFYDRLNHVIGPKLAPTADIKYYPDKLKFKGETDYPIAPLIVEIRHASVAVIR